MVRRISERAVVGSDHLLLADTLRRRQDRDPVYGDDRSKSGAAHRRYNPCQYKRVGGALW